MQLSPTVWGPFFWHTIHVVALGYPKEPNYTDKRTAKEFFEALAFLIPCAVCREHYSNHIHAHPITTFLDTRRDLLKWTIMIHNEVNKMLGKPIWTEQEVIDYYVRLGKRNRSPGWRKEDLKEVDVQSFVRGFLTGTAGLAALGGSIWVINKYLI